MTWPGPEAGVAMPPAWAAVWGIVTVERIKKRVRELWEGGGRRGDGTGWGCVVLGFRGCGGTELRGERVVEMGEGVWGAWELRAGGM